MSRQFLRVFILIAACCGPATAQNDSPDGLAMMKVEHSARSAGLGSAVTSITGDPSLAAFNPAGLAGIAEFTATFGHTFYWENIRLESGYFAMNLSRKVSLLGGVRFAAVDDLEGRGLTPTTKPTTIFEAHDISAKAGLAWQASDKLKVGFALGWFIQKIGAYRGSAFNVDLGLLATPYDNLQLGASVLNLGSDFNLENSGLVGSRDISLPTTWRTGGSYKYDRYLFAGDLVLLDDAAHLHLGIEAFAHRLLYLRAGYMLNYDSKNFAAGLTFVLRDLTVDYGFVPYTNNLGTSHLFSLNFSL